MNFDIEEKSFDRLQSELIQLQKLVESSEWLLFRQYVQSMLDAGVAQIVLAPLATMDDVLGQEYRKGGLARISELIGLPETLIEMLKGEIRGRQRIEDDENV